VVRYISWKQALVEDPVVLYGRIGRFEPNISGKFNFMKALCVFSGGLDSMLAAELVRAQGIDVLALFFKTPFFTPEKALKSAESIDLPFKVVDITERHLEIVKNPRHGYGGNMNPCIDCHTLMFQVAGEMLEKEGADFVISGEVLGQRPMSQNKSSLSIVSNESGLDGLLLRPLSARLLPSTVPENKGWIKRERLMDIKGRSRKPQIELAKSLGIKDYPSPAGGCVLTDRIFSRRLKDLLSSKVNPEIREIELLKTGRHFRMSQDVKLIVGRNKNENKDIRSLAWNNDFILSTISVSGPTALLMDDATGAFLETAAEITASYSDAAMDGTIEVLVEGRSGQTGLTTHVRDKTLFESYMV
jgi:tRNA-uridine 2-sulfurtransferase